MQTTRGTVRLFFMFALLFVGATGVGDASDGDGGSQLVLFLEMLRTDDEQSTSILYDSALPVSTAEAVRLAERISRQAGQPRLIDVSDGSMAGAAPPSGILVVTTGLTERYACHLRWLNDRYITLTTDRACLGMGLCAVWVVGRSSLRVVYNRARLVRSGAATLRLLRQIGEPRDLSDDMRPPTTVQDKACPAPQPDQQEGGGGESRGGNAKGGVVRGGLRPPDPPAVISDHNTTDEVHPSCPSTSTC